ncbi:hypothetical protein [Natronolimnohabitans innermongolicus]|uniref:Uncharacterized protein n=1 Tax=Natronolimnohabitans innermongolicus JCM 12255 TaxID=1227499 RepID=L9X2M1_9EURY|nr:hypothetical protein [Natronolimnohabitans innermongolicus]ELY55862.1 hypothetical protein C493_10303 [Natronolimnohabitans innermongolicus JCM 12255]
MGEHSDRAVTLVSAFRLAAFALLAVGFSGWVFDDGGEVSLESPYTLAFGLGVACALASIYLGIFLANRD